MNFDYNKKLEPENWVDGVNFTNKDPCIWNVYPPGCSGDLLSSLINCHYGRTGSDYFGINDHGQVIFRPSDYKITNVRHQSGQTLFDDQYFFDIATSLGNRNINYSMCDQFIFSCHLHRDQEINRILETFPQCKIIHTYCKDSHGEDIAKFMTQLKNCGVIEYLQPGFNKSLDCSQIVHSNVLHVPFGVFFNKQSYYKWYDKIIQFLNLNGRLICFDYIEYYISKQHPNIKNTLIEYGQYA